jgi:ring-1,2-phenylacetyl-CoA epoxidase subunit PaaC
VTAQTNTDARLPTRQLIEPDLPAFDASALDPELRAALADLLLAMADDEFVIGFRDSEWTGIAPALEEDVAFSSIAQDEIGHARLLYEMRAALTGEDPDVVAFHRQPSEYRHARLLDEPRQGWAFTIVRRWLYDTADSVRLAALSSSSFAPLAQIVAKIRREERYHVMHLDAWLERLATHPGTPRDDVSAALERLAPLALSVFTELPSEELLVDAGVLSASMSDLAGRWRTEANARLMALDLPTMAENRPPAEGRSRPQPDESFVWLWNEFTAVARLEEGATW